MYTIPKPGRWQSQKDREPKTLKKPKQSKISLKISLGEGGSEKNRKQIDQPEYEGQTFKILNVNR